MRRWRRCEGCGGRGRAKNNVHACIIILAGLAMFLIFMLFCTNIASCCQGALDRCLGQWDLESQYYFAIEPKGGFTLSTQGDATRTYLIGKLLA